MEEIGIESTLVESIKSGEKTLEARLGKPRFLRIKEDDIISIREDFWYQDKILESLPHALHVKITQVLYFESFKELFDTMDFQSAIPSAKTVDEAIAVYRKFYTSEEERELGVVALSFEVAERD